MGKGGMSKFLDILRLNDPDDDELGDDLFDEDDDDDDDDYIEKKIPKKEPKKFVPEKQSAPKMPAYKEPVDNSYSNDYRKPKATKQASSGNKLVSINNNQRNTSSRGNGNVYVMKPSDFDESQFVADYLNEGKTIIINMEGVDIALAQRIMDFVGGACYALGGRLEAISGNIFIAAPNNISIGGDVREEILNDNILAPDLGKF